MQSRRGWGVGGHVCWYTKTDLPKVHFVQAKTLKAGAEGFDHGLTSDAQAPAHKQVGPGNGKELGGHNQIGTLRSCPMLLDQLP